MRLRIVHGFDQMVSLHDCVAGLRDEFLPNREDAVW